MKTYLKRGSMTLTATLAFCLLLAQNEKQIQFNGQQFYKPGNPVFEPYKNKWPELKKGGNGLVQRFVSPKQKQISIDKSHCIAG